MPTTVASSISVRTDDQVQAIVSSAAALPVSVICVPEMPAGAPALEAQPFRPPTRGKPERIQPTAQRIGKKMVPPMAAVVAYRLANRQALIPSLGLLAR